MHINLNTIKYLRKIIRVKNIKILNFYKHKRINLKTNRIGFEPISYWLTANYSNH